MMYFSCNFCTKVLEKGLFLRKKMCKFTFKLPKAAKNIVLSNIWPGGHRIKVQSPGGVTGHCCQRRKKKLIALHAFFAQYYLKKGFYEAKNSLELPKTAKNSQCCQTFGQGGTEHKFNCQVGEAGFWSSWRGWVGCFRYTYARLWMNF